MTSQCVYAASDYSDAEKNALMFFIARQQPDKKQSAIRTMI